MAEETTLDVSTDDQTSGDARPQPTADAAADQDHGNVDARTGSPDQTLGEVGSPGQDDFITIRDAAKELGYNVENLEDDDAVLRHLVDRAVQASQVEPYLPKFQQYLQHSDQFDNYLRDQSGQQPGVPRAQQGPSQAQAEPNEYEPPPFNPAWAQMVKRDETTGAILPVPEAGGTAQIARAVEEHLAWRMSKQEEWASNPYAFMDKYLKKRDGQLRESILKEFQQNQAVSQEVAESRDFINQNSNWLYDRDTAGKVAVNPVTKQPVISRVGQQFMALVREAAELGIPSHAGQRHYAQRVLGSQGQPTAASSVEAQDAQRKMDFQASAAGAMPSSGASTNKPPDANGNTQPQNPQLSLDDMLRQELKTAGITDQDLIDRY